jgi:uncharacterized protein (DUF362 family)
MMVGVRARALKVCIGSALYALVLLSSGCGAAGAGGTPGNGGSSSSGTPGSGGVSGGGAGGSTGAKYVVAMLQASKEQSVDLTTSDVADLVGNAITQAGGLDFVKDGQTVVLKPNLITFYKDAGETLASQTASGINTDWRVVKAVADLVRAKNPTGKILVMEGATLTTPTVYSLLGYKQENFGSSVDEFVALEGAGCNDTGTTLLEQRTARSGKQYWMNSRYAAADVIIAIPTLATDAWSGVGGAVESLGIGASPAGQYGSAENQDVCTRTKIDHSSPQTMADFIRDYYGIRPADFVVMDGLQGLQHGPLPVWDDSGTYDYASSIENMRLILAGKNAVAVDTIATQVMKCAPAKVPFLTALQADGLGTTDTAQISVVGKAVTEVAQPFAGKYLDICPGL